MTAHTAWNGAKRWPTSPTWRGVIYDKQDRGAGWVTDEIVDRCKHHHRSEVKALDCSRQGLELWRSGSGKAQQ